MSFLYRAVMFAGSWVCHQLPERSPHLLGIQFPVCWRCTGIIVGAIVFLIWIFLRKKLPALGVSVALSLLLPLDVGYALITSTDGSNPRRFITGILWGVFGTSTVLHILKGLNARAHGVVSRSQIDSTS